MSGTARAARLVAKAAAGREPEALALEAAAVAREQPADDLDRLAQRREGSCGLDPELVEPGALDEAQVRAPVRGAVERGDLAGDLDGVEGVRVERGRADPDPPGRGRDLEQRGNRGREEEVVIDRDDVEARLLGASREGRVRSRRLVRLEAEADLAPRGYVSYVSSSLRIVRSPIRSIRITTRSSGSGQQTSESCSSQSSSGSRRCFAGSSGRTLWSA